MHLTVRLAVAEVRMTVLHEKEDNLYYLREGQPLLDFSMSQYHPCVVTCEFFQTETSISNETTKYLKLFKWIR